MDGIKYCSNCGIELDEKAEICPECGVRQAPPGAYYQGGDVHPVKEKSPELAALLSFLIVGVGQIYNGQVGKGVIILIAAVISGVLWTIGIGVIFSIIIWIYAIYDAYTTAKKINAGEIV
jgi:TM2 domain-containing membrane protein YozV